MKILLLNRGYSHEVGTFFWNALQELRINADCVDSRCYYPRGTNRLHFAYIKILQKYVIRNVINNHVRIKVKLFKPDMVLVVKGNDLFPMTMQVIKNSNCVLVNYATDDPFNKNVSSEYLRHSIPYYDVYFCTKRAIIKDVIQAGCRNVQFMPFGYDPKVHFRENFKNKSETKRFCSDVVFIGGGDDDRYDLMEGIKQRMDIDLRLYGGYWKQNKILRGSYRGFVFDRNFRLVLSGAKIGLGLVRHSNRDGHSMRTYEIPACDTLFIGERTDEHLDILTEDQECILFETIDELVSKINYYLNNECLRRKISGAGHRRIVGDQNSYKDRLMKIISI